MAHNPLSTYTKVSLQTASQVQLVVKLYEGAIKFLEKARSGFDFDDPIDRIQTIHNHIPKAQEIIHELNITLDMEQGGEMATQLRELYQYFDKRLFEANMKKDVKILEEVIERLTTLLEAWEEISQGPKQDD